MLELDTSKKTFLKISKIKEEMKKRINSEISDLIDDIAKIPNNKPYDMSKQRR